MENHQPSHPARGDPLPLPIPDPNVSRILFRSSLFGVIHCALTADHPSWSRQLHAPGCALSFPTLPVRYTFENQPCSVLSSNEVIHLGEGCPYRRTPAHPSGGGLFTLAVPQTLAIEAVREHDPHAQDRPDHPFLVPCGQAPDRVYYAMHRVVQYCRHTGSPDALAVEERCMSILRCAVASTHRPLARLRTVRSRETARYHAELVNNVKRFVAEHLAETLHLSRIARAVHSSPYHLARIFASHTGLPVHAYLLRLRLRAALPMVLDSRDPFADIARKIGFSSHSHFTAAFRRAFGTSPTAARTSRTLPDPLPPGEC